MPDSLSIVEYPWPGASPRTVLDLVDMDDLAYARGTLKPVPGAKRQTFSVPGRRRQPSRQTNESLDQAQFQWTAHVMGATVDEVAANVETALAALEDAAIGRRLRWRPGGDSGATRPVSMEILGTATWTPEYDSLKLQGGCALDVNIAVPVGLPEWDPIEIDDRFDVDSIDAGDWTLDNTSAADLALSTSGRLLVQTAVGGKQLAHTGRGVPLRQWDVVIPFKWRGTASAPTIRLRARRLSALLELGVEVGNTAMIAYKRATVGGFVNLGAGAGHTALTIGKVYWLRAWIDGEILNGQLLNLDPDRPDWTSSNVLDSVAFTLTSDEDELQAAGYPGLTTVCTGDVTSAPHIYGFRARPFTAREHGSLNGQYATIDEIPGSAPASIGLRYRQPASSNRPVFAMAAVWPRRRPFNLCQVGHFTTPAAASAQGWSDTALTGLTAAATINSVTNIEGPIPAETGYLRFTTTGAAANEGIRTRIARPLRKGRKYTVLMSARGVTADRTVELAVLPDGGAAIAGPDVVALLNAWTDVSLTFVAPATADGFSLAIRTPGTTAIVAEIGRVRVVAGDLADVALLGYRQGLGFGAPPAGHVRANARRQEQTPTSWTTGVGYTFADVLVDTAPSASKAYRAEWWIDPGELDPDPFGNGMVTLSVWIRWLLDPLLVAPKATVWAEPESGNGAKIYTSEGAAGRRLDTTPLGGAQRWLTKPHGTLTLPCLRDGGRWKLVATAQLAGGTAGTAFGLADLYLPPARALVTTPTGKVNDSAYPAFAAAVPIAKRVETDGRATARFGDAPYGPDLGMGGEPLELDPGDRAEIMFVASPQVPDDPVAVAGGDVLWTGSEAPDVGLVVLPRSRIMRG